MIGAAAARPGLLDFEAWCADYARYHTHPVNRLCHTFGIPLIMLALVRWTQLPVSGPLPWIALALPLYFAWDRRTAAAMTLVIANMALAAPYIGAYGAFAAFVVGWILQLVGHQVFEKKSPAFTSNLMHVLVGPMFILKKCLSF